MKMTGKSLVSLLLAVLMCVSLLCFAACADQPLTWAGPENKR